MSKHLVRDSEQLTDQRGSLAYVSPDILSGKLLPVCMIRDILSGKLLPVCMIRAKKAVISIRSMDTK